MKLILPPKLDRRAFERALSSFRAIVGEESVLVTAGDRESYLDAFRFDAAADHVPSAAVTPHSVEQVQAIVRVANEFKVPLWPISRGKNLAYGGSAPRMSGTVVLDMGRMRRILEVDAQHAYCRLEPGVGFYDLYDHIEQNHLPLWVSVPKHSWGSVVGNALERGLGESPYADHAQNICGMEVVLPTGALIRTGMGARTNSKVSSLFKNGYGPGWDQMFCQSNFGIVTSLGMWLMPEPDTTINFSCKVDDLEALQDTVDMIAKLRREGIVDAYMSMASWLGVAAVVGGQRQEYYDGPGAIPDDVALQIRRKLDIGWWNFDICVYGHEEITLAKARILEQSFTRHGRVRFTRTDSRQAAIGASKPGKPVPDMMPMQFINWYGGRGGHVDFSPVLPPTGAAAVAQYRSARRRFDEVGQDFFSAYHFGLRHLIAPHNIIFDRDKQAMTQRVQRLFTTLLKDAAAEGLTEYRTHLAYMDTVAQTFDYNNHSLLQLNESIKDAIDPNGVLAPGKSGIWPRAYRRRSS